MIRRISKKECRSLIQNLDRTIAVKKIARPSASSCSAGGGGNADENRNDNEAGDVDEDVDLLTLKHSWIIDMGNMSQYL